jgi:imidazolonepropionase-like amidohydrolase
MDDCVCRDYSQSDLYYGFTLIDPASKSIRNDAYLVITDGRFSEVGSGKPPQKNFRTRRALPGRFGLPGFVDAHAHITAGPHKVAIVNGAPAVTIESIDDVTQFNARMALAFGVTTVRNPAGDPLANAQYDRSVRSVPGLVQMQCMQDLPFSRHLLSGAPSSTHGAMPSGTPRPGGKLAWA